MTTLHDQRAAKMGYGAAPSATAPVRPAAPKKSIYNTDGLDRPLSSYYDRREAKLRSDAEGLRIARQERAQVEAFARKRGISADDLQQALSVVHEHDEWPRSQAAIEQRRTHTKEALRLEHGGVEEANAHLKRYMSVTSALAQEIPTLAARANATGAGEDPRLINVLAHYGESPKE
jgi:hypothetical protein